ncbi:hypothetical protein HOG48_02125 [Candidatus Peregrinibacteria bacterium]|jgi:uncharacterized protein (TIRG00374 family)|nr:hypothetical protein [Candidatus Peregrinibacteria bacterium]
MKINKWFSYILAFLLIGVVFYFSKDQWQYFSKIKDVSLYGFCFVSLYFILSQIIQAFQLKWYMKIFKIDLTNHEAFGLICLQAFGNYLPLSGGVVSNMAYLKAKRELPVARYFSYLLGDTILKFFIYGLLGIILLLSGSFIFHMFEINWMVILFLVCLILSSALCIFFPTVERKSEHKVIAWLHHMHESWALLRKNKNLMLKNTLTHILVLVLIALQFSVLFDEIGIKMSFSAILILTIITNIIKITSLFPGNLGLRETVSGGVTKMFGFNFASGFAASLLGRVITMIWIFLFGIYFSFSFSRVLRK